MSADFPSFAAMVDAFRLRHPGPLAAASIGFAGAVVDGRGAGTNVPWPVDSGFLAGHLALPRVSIVNDMVAMGYGVPALAPGDLEALAPGPPAADGNAAIIAAGTGLGETILARVGLERVPVASEAGYADFAPRTDEELEVFRALRARFGRVSYEHVLSGPGLVNVAETLHRGGASERAAWAEHTGASPAALPSVISRNALSGSCQSCVKALACFVGIYGAEAGNLALRAVARGGVYLAGGIAPRILPALRGETFLGAFRSKPPHEALLSGIPVWVVRNERVALLGAARFATLVAGSGAPV